MPTTYNPTLVLSSYETTRKIEEKINNGVRKCFGVPEDFFFINLNPDENYQNDGYVVNKNIKLEMKQRQSYMISDAYRYHRFYKDTTIQKSSTTHSSSVYIIYDLSLRYIQVFVVSDINNDKLLFRNIKTEYGRGHGVKTPISLCTVSSQKTRFYDIENLNDIRKLVYFLKEKLHK